MAEDCFFVAAVAADMDTHVLDNADNRNSNLAEHFDTLAGIQQGDILRSCHYYCSGQRNFLCQRQLNITSTWRHINYQEIQFTPVGLREQLLKGSACHGSTPDRRGPFGSHEAHRHTTNTMGHHGLQQLIVHLRPSTLWYAQQRALARAIDISIE